MHWLVAYVLYVIYDVCLGSVKLFLLVDSYAIWCLRVSDFVCVFQNDYLGRIY